MSRPFDDSLPLALSGLRPCTRMIDDDARRLIDGRSVHPKSGSPNSDSLDALTFTHSAFDGVTSWGLPEKPAPVWPVDQPTSAEVEATRRNVAISTTSMTDHRIADEIRLSEDRRLLFGIGDEAPVVFRDPLRPHRVRDLFGEVSGPPTLDGPLVPLLADGWGPVREVADLPSVGDVHL